MSGSDHRGAIGFAEKVLELLDEGRYTATYKYAVLLALLDLCLEWTQRSGAPPQIVSSIRRFRERHAPGASVTRWQSQQAVPRACEHLVQQVEWKLIEMPLPRLQTMGRSHRPFIYEICWDQGVAAGEVANYQGGKPTTFDNLVRLKPGVGEYLLQLSGLLRPLIQRRWAAMVAQLNRMEESQLEEFLFGADRTPTARVRAGLWEIQGGRCFYCDARVNDPVHAEVDHFASLVALPGRRARQLRRLGQAVQRLEGQLAGRWESPVPLGSSVLRRCQGVG